MGEQESMGVFITEKNNLAKPIGSIIVTQSSPLRVEGHFAVVDKEHFGKNVDFIEVKNQSYQQALKAEEIWFEVERMSARRGDIDPIPMLIQEIMDEDFFWQKSNQNGDLVPFQPNAKRKVLIESLTGTVPLHLAMGFTKRKTIGEINIMEMDAEDMEENLSRYFDGEAVNNQKPTDAELKRQKTYMRMRDRRKVMTANNETEVNAFRNWQALGEKEIQRGLLGRIYHDVCPLHLRQNLGRPCFVNLSDEDRAEMNTWQGFQCDDYFRKDDLKFTFY
jgi:hypothetical protein